MAWVLARHCIALALVALDMLVRAVRLRLLLSGSGEPRPSFWSALSINAYGEAASAVTPGRWGGDPIRFFALRRAGVNASASLASLAVETLIDWVLLGAAAVVLGLTFADTAAAGARRLLNLATKPEARIFVAATLVLIVAAAVALRRHRPRLPAAARAIPAAWLCARQLGWKTLLGAGALTAASMIARTAILPVLVAGRADIGVVPLVLGSFTLLYGQLLLPTPAGAGAVELGFLGGFAGTLRGSELAGLLLAWRIYSLVIGAALGAILLARSGLARYWMSRRYRSSNVPNVRSQE
jgi:uncharacterized membrane protein YbhN (UPF0104 family)